MLECMIKVYNLSRARKAESPHIGQPFGSIDEKDNLLCRAQSATNGLLAQTGAKLLNGTETRNIGRRFIIAHRMALFVGLVLGEDAPQVSHTGLGATISLFARSPH